MPVMRRAAWAAVAVMAACGRTVLPATEAVPVVSGASVQGVASFPASSPDSSAPPRSSTAALPPPDTSLASMADSIAASGAVSATATELFAESAAGDRGAAAPAPSPSTDSAATAEPTWDIDVRSYETRERVAFYLERFQGEARPRFALWLARAGRYEPLIRAKLSAAGLPSDLTYLALVESGYDPNAYSSAAAVGIWQLMTGTARGLGLRVDWWIDERRDPVRSTDAAIRFLKVLEEQFGSLYLAAAAYNGGPGRVARGLSRHAGALEGLDGDDAFFALAETDYLRAETRDYVPKLIAAALIAKAPARYGFPVTTDPPLSYDSVDVGPSVPLATIAAAAATPLGEIVELNGQILRGMTPPKGHWWVRVPTGRSSAIAAALSPTSAFGFKRYVTRRTATIATVSAKFDISWRQFIWFNPDYRRSKPSTKLSAGTAVRIPTAGTLAAARDVPDPAIERYGSSRRGATTHVVRQGESLSRIADHYGTTVASLQRLNRLRSTVIFPGQVIVIRARPHGSRSKSGSTIRH